MRVLVRSFDRVSLTLFLDLVMVLTVVHVVTNHNEAVVLYQ